MDPTLSSAACHTRSSAFNWIGLVVPAVQSFDTVPAGAFHLEHAAFHPELQVCGILGQPLLDSRVLELDRRSAVSAGEEQTVMGMLRIRAGHVCVVALDPGDKTLRHQKLEG